MTNLIKADFHGTQVLFQNNAYLNATAIASRFGKKAKDYLKSARTKEYINALINHINSKGRKIPFEENQLVTIKKGSPINGGGTWLHPKLAIDFARWLSAEFAVWCDGQIESILYKNGTPEAPKLETPYIGDEQLEHIKKGVGKMVHETGRHWQTVYHDLFDYVGAPSVREIRKERYNMACEFLGIGTGFTVPADKAQCYLPRSGYHRYLTVVENGKVISQTEINNAVILDKDVAKNLIRDIDVMATAQNELKARCRVIFGEVSTSRLDTALM